VANWPLLLVQIAEGVAQVVIVVGGVLMVALPAAYVAAGTGLDVDQSTPWTILRSILFGHPLLLLFVVVAVTLILIISMALHSFVKAGTTGIYLDGESAAPLAVRSAFRRFTPERWLEYGRAGWWQIFLIYNILWGLFGVILLLPAIGLAMAMYWFDGSGTRIAIGCAGLVLLVLILFFGGLFIHLWSQVALVISLREKADASRSIRSGLTILKLKAGEILLMVLVLFAAILASSVCLIPISLMAGVLSSIPGVALLTLPLQVFLSIAQNLFSVVVASWFLAAMVSIVAGAGRVTQRV